MKYLILSLTFLLLSGCSEQQSSAHGDHLVNQTLYTAVSHPDRPAVDRQRDEKRKPAEVLEFLGVNPGMTIIEVMAGGGYYTELLSRAVGPSGKVYHHNNQMYYQFQSDKFVEQRLKNNRLPNVTRWDRELDNLELAENSVDAVFMMLVFHDFYWSKDDPSQVLQTLYNTIKPGGIMAIVDHSAKTGSGDIAANSLHGIHRIDEQLVHQAMTKAGFVLDGESDILRNPHDDREKAFFDNALIDQATDRFVLRFKKPE